jgi:hypothetical protein
MVIKLLFRQLLKKTVSMALWTKASLCVKSSLIEQSFPRTTSRLKQSLPTYQVGPCNPWLIKDLRENKALYNCRETSTNIESSLQIKLFMQNKAKFRKVKLNVNKVLTKDYELMDTWSIGKKQSQTNPNKAKIKKADMNVTVSYTRNYENKSPIRRKNKAKLRNDKKQCKPFYRKGL